MIRLARRTWPLSATLRTVAAAIVASRPVLAEATVALNQPLRNLHPVLVVTLHARLTTWFPQQFDALAQA